MERTKMKDFTISVDTNGTATMIYDDENADLINESVATIERVSNVEPAKGGWVAFMKDGTKLGPFKLRYHALEAEVAYLENKLFGGNHA
jgi:hypothetical protein